ncbi:TPA: HdeD family acid-resistance protein [Salmonella enterica subsp. enterica serovar Eastbourne]
MFNITQDILSKLDDNILTKERRFLRLLAFLMFTGGALFLLFPFISGRVLSIFTGTILICSGTVLIISTFKNRTHNFWSVVSGILVSIAYILIGYLFITAQNFGVSAIASFIACVFFIGGVIRLMTWFRLRNNDKVWLQGIVGILDMFIAWCFIDATPQASAYMVSTVTGFELICSALSFAYIASLFRKS